MSPPVVDSCISRATGQEPSWSPKDWPSSSLLTNSSAKRCRRFRVASARFRDQQQTCMLRREVADLKQIVVDLQPSESSELTPADVKLPHIHTSTNNHILWQAYKSVENELAECKQQMSVMFTQEQVLNEFASLRKDFVTTTDIESIKEPFLNTIRDLDKELAQCKAEVSQMQCNEDKVSNLEVQLGKYMEQSRIMHLKLQEQDKIIGELEALKPEVQVLRARFKHCNSGIVLPDYKLPHDELIVKQAAVIDELQSQICTVKMDFKKQEDEFVRAWEAVDQKRCKLLEENRILRGRLPDAT